MNKAWTEYFTLESKHVIVNTLLNMNVLGSAIIEHTTDTLEEADTGALLSVSWEK